VVEAAALLAVKFQQKTNRELAVLAAAEMVVEVRLPLGPLIQQQAAQTQAVAVVVAGEYQVMGRHLLDNQAAPVWSSSKCLIPILQPSLVA
jgi:hypothetical protein